MVLLYRLQVTSPTSRQNESPKAPSASSCRPVSTSRSLPRRALKLEQLP